MNPIIAVLSRDGVLCPIEQCTVVLLFCRIGGRWAMREEIPWHLIARKDPQDVRDQVRSLILELGECRIIVAERLVGLAYHVFDRMGFAVFEATEIGDDLFDSVLSDVQTAAEQPEGEPLGPAACDSQGRFELDLIILQKKHPEISSKRALREFLRGNRNFYELRILCSHVPPWLEMELPALRLDWRTEKLPDGRLSVTIFRRTCKEGLI